MITQEQVMPLLLEACPSFRPAWESELDDVDRTLTYTCLVHLAEHLLYLHKNKTHDEFGAVAKVIEKLHVDGDDYVQEAATIGLLEGIQNVWGNSGADPEEFRSFLLPESAKWWDELNRFWLRKIPYVGATLPESAFWKQVARKGLPRFRFIRRPLSPERVDRESMGSRLEREWLELRSQMQPGDQLWPFTFHIRGYLGMRRGYLLLRRNQPVGGVLTEVS